MNRTVLVLGALLITALAFAYTTYQRIGLLQDRLNEAAATNAAYQKANNELLAHLAAVTAINVAMQTEREKLDNVEDTPLPDWFSDMLDRLRDKSVSKNGNPT